MTVTPLVSIILTFHNSVDLVDTALELVARQTFRDYELIVVDDGSTDGTAEKLRQETSAIPNLQVIAKQRNGGVAAARNSAVAIAGGSYVWFLDCDDWWDPTTLAKLVLAVREGDADMAVCRAVRSAAVEGAKRFPLDGLAESRIITRDDAIRMLVDGRIRGYLWNKLISTCLLRAHPFPELSSLSDITGMASLIGGVERVAFIPDMLYVHLVRDGSITNRRNPKLRNIETAWLAIRRLAIVSGVFRDGDKELVYFDYRQYYAAVVNTYFRVGSDDEESRAHLQEVRERMGWRGSLVVWSFDRRLALVTMLMRYTGSAYPAVYGSFRSLFR